MLPSHLSLSVGTLLSQRYRIEGLIGEGAIAQVYRATDLLSNRVVAIKILRADLARSDEAIARLRREGEILRSLRHPALVAVESVGEEDGRIYLVMELLRGRTLRERMQRGQMGVHELVPIVTEAASALSLAHSHGVIHRDLKPENIFLLPDHPTQHTRIKILDFGISKVLSAKTLTETGEILGTPRYIAPEQLNAEPIDARVDVYALGVILYEALAGRPPFSASTLIDLVVAILEGKVTPLRAFRPDISPELESVVLCAMARKREERFRSVEAMARAFVVAAQPLIPQSASIERRTYPMGEMGAYRDGPRLIGPSPQGIDLGTFSRVPLKQPITQSREKREEEKNSASATIDPASVATSLPTESIASLDGDRLVEHQDGGIHPQAPKRTNFSRPKRLLLIVAGFAVLSALMAIWVLGRKESTKTLPSTKNGAISSDHLVGVGTPAQNGEATRAKVQKEDPTPSPPASPNGESTPSPKGQRVTRLKNSKGVGEENLTNSEPTAHPPPTPDYESILKLAQDSLRAGNPKHCVELLNDLIARFPLPIALRQRADCLLEMGEREAAIRDYRRFCRFAPEHPSVEEVRAAVQKLGVGCP